MRIGLVINWNKPVARRFVPDLVRWLEKKGHKPILFDKPHNRVPGPQTWELRRFKEVDLVVALGGDGTLLRAVRLVGKYQKPIMGVNLGGLGFLTEFSLQKARAGIEGFVHNEHCEEKRMLLACSREGKSKKAYALNDCALNMGPSGRVIEIVVWWAPKAVNLGVSTERSAEPGRALGTKPLRFVNKFVGDGIVVATPTGSTAYSLATGGPVVYPTMSAIILTPICPHALSARPIVLPGDAEVILELTNNSQPAVLNLDGQTRWRINPKTRIRITQADFYLRLVVPKEKSYFEILREKLKWSGGQR